MRVLIIAASAVALSTAAVPALAQTPGPTSLYINLGDTYLTPDHGSFNEITGRMGARFGPNFGLEGEIGGGVSSLNGAYGKTTEPVAGAGYVVGYWPVMPRFDLLARVGYGEANFHTSFANGQPNSSNTYGSLNYGAGAQYFFTANDGVRGDYTRRDYQGTGAPVTTDTWALAWVHRF